MEFHKEAHIEANRWEYGENYPAFKWISAAGYMEKFKIRGVGLSGGEPLLTFDRTLQFLTRIKKRSGIHRSDDFLRGHQFILLVKVEVLAQPLFIRPLQVVWNCLMGVSLLLDYPLNLVFWGFRPRPPFAMSW